MPIYQEILKELDRKGTINESFIQERIQKLIISYEHEPSKTICKAVYDDLVFYGESPTLITGDTSSHSENYSKADAVQNFRSGIISITAAILNS